MHGHFEAIPFNGAVIEVELQLERQDQITADYELVAMFLCTRSSHVEIVLHDAVRSKRGQLELQWGCANSFEATSFCHPLGREAG